MQAKTLLFLCVVFAAAIISIEAGGGGGGKHKVLIHIPYHHKTIKHTHTIYKIVKDKKKEEHKHVDVDHGWEHGGGHGFGGGDHHFH